MGWVGWGGWGGMRWCGVVWRGEAWKHAIDNAKNYMKTYREYKMVTITFREYRFQRFVAYCLSEFNSAKKKKP